MDLFKLILTALAITGLPVIILVIFDGNFPILPFILIAIYGIPLYIFFRSFKSLTTKEWLYNLRPFRPIGTLIQQAYPNEKVIISKKLVFEGFISILKIGKLPFLFQYQINFPSPAFLIETDKGYYVDRRLQQILNWFILGPLIVLGAYFITEVLHIEIEFLDILVSQLGVSVFLLLASLEVLYSLFAQVNRVDVIRKEWISSEKKGKHSVILSGTIPSNSQLTLSKDKFINSGRIATNLRQVFYSFYNIKIR